MSPTLPLILALFLTLLKSSESPILMVYPWEQLENTLPLFHLSGVLASHTLMGCPPQK